MIYVCHTLFWWTASSPMIIVAYEGAGNAVLEGLTRPYPSEDKCHVVEELLSVFSMSKLGALLIARFCPLAHCIFVIKLLLVATNQARELSWASACGLVRDQVHLI